jgi:DNA invertase Pin-like site-specific DNA recombinase
LTEAAGAAATSDSATRTTAARLRMERKLVGQALDRFTRGAGDAPGAARHLVELWHELRRRNVHLRTFEDDENIRDSASVAAAGQAAMIESRRRSRSTRKGKRRRAKKGLLLGGPVADGYTRIAKEDEDGPFSTYELDPARARIVRRISELAPAGMTPAAIARRLNCEGFRTRRNVTRSGPNAGREWGGKPWTRRRVYDTLTCSVYVGVEAVPRRSGALEGHHPALVDPETFDRVQRSLARATRRPTGRPRRGGRVRDTCSPAWPRAAAAASACTR